MGKGTIISGGIGGEYSVEIAHRLTVLNDNIAKNTASLVTVNAQIAAETDKDKLTKLKLTKASLLAEQKYLQELATKINTTGWCVDVTEDMTGTVGTIEVPGERGSFVNLHNDNAHTPARDGQLEKAGAGKTAGVIWNLAMLPGWQKWKPTYRYATITALTISETEGGTDYCDVTLESAVSTQQSLDVNQATTLSNVEIDYMDCNGAGFKVGDIVVVQFTGQDWNSPKVIGYKTKPKYCHHIALIAVYLIRLTKPLYLVDDYPDKNFTDYSFAKKAVIAWDAKNNKIIKGPVDYDDANFQKWYQMRDVITSSSASRVLCGTVDSLPAIPGTVTQPSGCQMLVPGGEDTWYVGPTAPDLTVPSATSKQILAAKSPMGEIYDYSMHPVSGYIQTTIGDNEELTTTGVRTESVSSGTDGIVGEKWTLPDGYDEYGNWHETGDWISYTKTSQGSYTYTYYTPLGGGSNTWGVTVITTKSPPGDVVTNSSGFDMIESYHSFDLNLFLAYTKNVFVDVCIRQQTMTRHPAAVNYYEGVRTILPREIYVEGNALYDRNSVYGVDWITAGRNSAFEAAVKSAIEQAYTINGITDNYVREAKLVFQFLR